MNIIIPIKQSREVKLKDIFRVLWDSTRIKLAMRKPFPGKYPWASSVSHCQISENPLRFFVADREGGMSEEGVRLKQSTKLKKYFGARTIINPEIIETGKNFTNSREGCMSFPQDKIVKVKRHEVVTCRYWTFFGPRTRKFFLFRASLLQHELDHMDLTNIYERHDKFNWKGH